MSPARAFLEDYAKVREAANPLFAAHALSPPHTTAVLCQFQKHRAQFVKIVSAAPTFVHPQRPRND